MARQFRDPWKKKYRKGSKTMFKMIDVGVKLGAAAAQDISRQSKQNQKNIDTDINQELGGGCIAGITIFIVAVFFTFIISRSFFLALLIGGVLGSIIGLLISSTENNKNSTPAKKSINKLPIEVEEKIKNISQLIIHDNHMDDINSLLKDDSDKKLILINAYDQAIEHFLSDNLLSKEEENKLIEYQNYFSLSQNDLNQNGAYEKVVKASILREIIDGKIPVSYKIIDGEMPFMLNKNEKLIWIFQNVDYYEDMIKKQYVGNNNGVSMRIVNGLYYRTGGFRGNTIETRQLKYFGNGFLGITDKNIYYHSLEKIFKIPYTKMISCVPYSDGVQIQRDAMTAKPQYFKNVDSWFLYNLIMNLNNFR